VMEKEVKERNKEERTLFGFWIYLMTDLIMFAALFATFAVLRNNTFGGPAGKELFSLPYVLIETLILLTSSFTCGLGMIAAHRKSKKGVLWMFGVTLALGLSFLGMEINEFTRLFSEGNSFQRSGFLSSFFTLVGTHGLHITFGSLWMVLVLIHILRKGLTEGNIRKLTLLSLFWHFLDVVWIFIFTIVYLLGAI
jgi:cytochrome o ubiquinol oxidase subunit III